MLYMLYKPYSCVTYEMPVTQKLHHHFRNQRNITHKCPGNKTQQNINAGIAAYVPVTGVFLSKISLFHGFLSLMISLCFTALA